MTTSPVMTLTEELLAELEEKGRTHFRHVEVKPATVLALIARIKELEAREVELPEPRRVRNGGSHESQADAMGFNDALEYCQTAIEAAGVRVKP